MSEVAEYIDQLVVAANRTGTTQLYAVQHGKPLASIDAGAEPLPTMSVTKLVVGIVIGRAVRLGHLDIDQPVHDWFSEWKRGPRSRITVRHVMGHISGLAADTWPQLDASPPPDLLSYVLHDLPLVEDPGTVWAYNNAAVMLLPAIISRATQQPYLDFARDELLRPLGVDEWSWRCDEAGNPLGMATAAFNAIELARFGELLERNGRWDDQHLLPDDWVETCREPPLPGLRGAGLLLLYRWAQDKPTGEPVTYGHDGSGGQHLWIFPASGLVVTRLRNNRLPSGGFDPGTAEQAFRDLPKYAASIDTALTR